MLELKGIRKIYPAGDGSVEALKGIDLRFRKSEFVSILGPSGCGKTTMLNIIGGLDGYTEGDLVINGRSTKDFRDRDWDAYRNRSVGFVFQSYNLIPHQSVLRNVELALILTGVGKKERRERAKKALKEVGLADQMNKRPSELSGGQMQRVAIARAIVTDPDIILADEPTGALDTETSVQVMEILKEISKDRLIVMVTHNPDLAEKYSTRIIRMLDGKITGDSSPLSESEIESEQAHEKALAEDKSKQKNPSMSFATSFGLSLKNLFTKKGRTALTAFAGSIGIIGIALIFAVSRGTTNYINTVQEDTLSSYPLTLEAEHMDLGTLLTTMIGATESTEKHGDDAVYQKSVVYNLIHSLTNLEASENDLRSFKSYLETEKDKEDSPLGESLNGIRYTYDFDLDVYTENVEKEIIRSDAQKLLGGMISEVYGANAASAMSGSMSSSPMASMMSSGSSTRSFGLWQEMLAGTKGELINPLLMKQYDLVYGSWPNEYNEIVLVLDERNELDDMSLYALGLKTREEILEVMRSSFNKEEFHAGLRSWSYEEICEREYHVVLPADCMTKDESTGLFTDLRETETGLRYLYDNGIVLHVVGIIRPSEDAVSSMLSGSIAYTSALTDEVIRRTAEAASVKAQKENPDADIFTGLLFREATADLSETDKAATFRREADRFTAEEKAAAYLTVLSIPSDEVVAAQVAQTVGMMSREKIEETLAPAIAAQTGMGQEEIAAYLASMGDEELKALFAKLVEENVRSQYAEGVRKQTEKMTPEQLAAAFDMMVAQSDDKKGAEWYELLLEFSDSSYEKNLSLLGLVDPDEPSSINLYASTFAGKDVIEEAISDYNDGVDELSKISYTDYVGLMMSSVTTVINAITYVLIAFVAISLVVSSIMIGVITLISVQERTKEIGILRAIGASKKDVSGMFNAETIIIGFISGLLGVVITYLLCIPINLIIHALTGLNNLSAYLPPEVAVILVVISVLLTLIAGIIPSRSAAKKDPVVALRSE